MTQLALNFTSGQKLRDKGIKLSVDNANTNDLLWSDRALEFLILYPGNEFQAEDVRVWAGEQGLPDPPSNRAWGSVIVTAKKMGLIKHAGYRNVKNPAAHATPASVWQRVS